MLICTNLNKQYPGQERRAVADLSLQVQGGEIYGFLGPNGAGKSTTIKMIVSLLRPDSGTISLAGISLADEPVAFKRLVGYCADEPLFYEKMTGREHLIFSADLYGIDESTRVQRIEELSKELLLVEELEKPINSYSHGMRQKLSVIAAMLHEPELLILDEPMVGLDPQASFNLKELLKRYAASGKIVFFSTHVLEVAQQLCTKLGIIDRGALLFDGTFEELRSLRAQEAANLEALFLQLTGEQQ